MILSNGKSKVFTGNDGENDQDMKQFDISDFSKVKRINGTKHTSSNTIHKLKFCKSDGTEITAVELGSAQPYGEEFVLACDEEIIGMFGTKDKDNLIWTLGFIAWKPPRI